ncbi:MAG: putative transcriptional regulator [Lentimonas sp.]|jgi:putative transcriptional regulator
MRLISEGDQGHEERHLAGSLLVAHPSLLDPQFKRAVVLLTAHSGEGSLGVIVNRPLYQTLGQYDSELAGSEFADVPLYEGGPVACDQMVLVAWKWCGEDGTFKLYFGIDEAKARQILQDDSGFELRGFIGHSGWGEGQLEGEIETDSWVLSPLNPDLEDEEGVAAWRSILSQLGPEMRLLAEEPDDLSVN